MIRINLLPHRAEKRKARQIQFIAFGVISFMLGAMLVLMVHLAIIAQIDVQERRNNFLTKEIAILDKQIDEIKKLREQTKSLLARKKVVEDLQSTRSDVVHLLDQMLRILPDGVYLKSLKQTGLKISIVGLAQSNARVSTLMRAIEDSPWLGGAVLVEIHATNDKGGRLNEFQLNFNLLQKQLSQPATGKPPVSNIGPKAELILHNRIDRQKPCSAGVAS